MVCIEGICFTSLYDAGKFLMVMAERGERVTIDQRQDWSNCLIHEDH